MYDLDVVAGCQGWRLEAGPGGSQAGLDLSLRFGPLYRLRVFLDGSQPGPTAVQGYLELTGPGRDSHHHMIPSTGLAESVIFWAVEGDVRSKSNVN